MNQHATTQKQIYYIVFYLDRDSSLPPEKNLTIKHNK